MKRVDRLPDCYRKDQESNHYKLLSLTGQDVDELKQDIQWVRDSLDLEKAFGQTLNLYGDMMGQNRGILNDEQFRYILKSRIAMNHVEGDYNSILQTVSLIVRASLHELEFKDGNLPCSVEVVRFPFQVLVNAGFSSKQALQMISMLLPVCVTISADNFEGTFEFSDVMDTYDRMAGFADLGQSYGGYFGLLFGEDDAAGDLPI